MYLFMSWILLISHGSLTFVGLSKSDLHSLSHSPTFLLLLLHPHLGQLCWCKRGGHPWHLWDHGFMGNGKEGFWCEGAKAFWCYATFCITIIGFAFNLECWGYVIISTQGIRNHKVMGAKYWSCGYKRWGAGSTTTITKSCWLFCF
jgi:hypothetical protein